MNEQIITGEIVTGHDIVPMDLVQRAILQGADVVVLDKLMALEERWQRNQAHKAYSGAIADAKAEFGTINKSRQVEFTNRAGQRTSYRHEDMSDIAAAVDGPLSKHGLSYRWHTDSDIKAGTVKVTCVVSHRDGYSVENSLTGAFDVSGGKNPIQSLGSACTYLERYTLKAALGLVPDDDDDAQSVSQGDAPEPPPRQQTRQQPRQAQPEPTEPYSLEPPADRTIHAEWRVFGENFVAAYRTGNTKELLDKWVDVNRDTLEMMMELEPAMYKQINNALDQHRLMILRRPPPQ